MIRLTHVTQLGQGRVNLCGQACASMLVAYYTGVTRTAREFAEATGTADNSFTTFTELLSMLRKFGLTAEYQRPADWNWWRDRLERGAPAIALVDYRQFRDNPNGYTAAHFVVPVAVSHDSVMLHDPLRLTGPTLVSVAEFQAAISTPSIAGNSTNLPYQAVAVGGEMGVTKRGMGYNVHSSYVTEAEWNKLLIEWQATRPGALLLLDSFNEVKGVNKALQVANVCPDTTVIYRRNIPDNAHLLMTPAEWVNEHRDLAGSRVYCSVNNEPHGDATKIANWHYAVALAAKQAGIRVSIGGFSVGGYDDETLAAHVPLLRWMAANPGWAVLDLHEYTRALWTVDFDRDAKDPARWPAYVAHSQPLWLMGGFRRWLNFCDAQGIKRPRIVIGEWGLDRVQAVPPDVYGDTEGLHTCAPVWQSWGFEDWQQYAAMQLQVAWKAIYAAYPEVLGVCYFQLQTGDKWATFNAYTAPRFMELTREGFDTMAVTQPQPVTGYAAGAYTLDYVGGRVNVRSGPSTSAGIVGTVGHGDPVDVLDAAVTVDGKWLFQRVQGGYMATKGGAWTLAPRTVDSEAWAMVKQARDQLTAALVKAGVE
ncbi:MAG: hypothetical protein B6D42_15520 [Anaerolineae bacterium UTCFX5]|nr:MAG: hypothetical protein B6D42_15520 [Anaerolineae bacterium UTCFX5]